MPRSYCLAKSNIIFLDPLEDVSVVVVIISILLASIFFVILAFSSPFFPNTRESNFSVIAPLCYMMPLSSGWPKAPTDFPLLEH